MTDLHDRIYPENVNAQGLLNLRMHVARYDFALSQMVHGGKVLDAGCGAGYGSRMLSWLASRVVAIDRSIDAIDYAKKFNFHPRIEYQVCDIRDIIASDFDNVVCYEVLEHNENSEELLQYLLSRLKVGGRGLFSLPVNSNAPGHRRVFTYPDAIKIFMGLTGKIYYQRGIVLSSQQGDDANVIVASVVNDGDAKKRQDAKTRHARGLL